jgi:hypothetical protein
MLNPQKKESRLSEQPIEELYRSCENEGWELSGLTWQKDFPRKAELIDLLVYRNASFDLFVVGLHLCTSQSGPRHASPTQLWKQIRRSTSNESIISTHSGVRVEVNAPETVWDLCSLLLILTLIRIMTTNR